MKKQQEQFIAGLDIGSSAIRMAVGHIAAHGGEGGELQILGAAEVPSEGVHRGVISSIEDVVSSVSACLEEVERMVGAPLDSVWLGVSGTQIISQMSKGVVAVSKGDSEITEEDVERAIEASRAIATPLNYEVLHVLPRTFTIDGQSGIKDPVGMTGVRLEVDTQIILAASAQVKNTTKAIYRAGLEIEDVVLSMLATAEGVVTARQKELGVVVVNIGATTTSVAVFEEGELIHTAILPIGSGHITNDIAIGLRTSIDIAEAVKLTYADCSLGTITKEDQFDLMELGAADHELIKKQYLYEIVQARVEELMNKIYSELQRCKKTTLLPAGVIFTGGGAKIPGLVEVAKKYVRLPASLGYPLHMVSVTDKVNDLAFSTAVGLVKWGSIMKPYGGAQHAMRQGNARKMADGVTKQVKDWFKTLIP
jgi:cell division protein FtsA